METKHYDLIAIGAGPGGVWGARTAAGFNKRVAIVEKTGLIGGAGINTGTLPSKTLRETALRMAIAPAFRCRSFAASRSHDQRLYAPRKECH
jgi:pyruvate/2-oxoglutarate dehydrogenase complex dihydrolipoamide dehydrogenase (E3) component